MGSLATLLIVGLLLTDKYTSFDAADYALCSFHNIVRAKSDGSAGSDALDLDFTSMVLSILFVGLGSLIRIIKLHQIPSVSLVACGRAF